MTPTLEAALLALTSAAGLFLGLPYLLYLCARSARIGYLRGTRDFVTSIHQELHDRLSGEDDESEPT